MLSSTSDTSINCMTLYDWNSVYVIVCKIDNISITYLFENSRNTVHKVWVRSVCEYALVWPEE